MGTAGSYVTWGVLQISVTNLVIILLMLAVFALVVRAGSTCRCHQAVANPVLWIGAAASWAAMRSRRRSRSVRVNVQSNGVAVAL